MTDEELNSQGNWVWVPEKTEVYVPAKLEGENGKKIRVARYLFL